MIKVTVDSQLVLLHEKTERKFSLPILIPVLDPLIDLLLVHLLVQHGFFLVHAGLAYRDSPKVPRGRRLALLHAP